jgi:cobalt/nickel transport system ATP-binding protein
LLGANGSGKSTLLRLLNGLVFPRCGRFLFKGRDITEESLREPALRQEFRRSCGFVFQNSDAQLFNATVYDEIAFGPRQLLQSEEEVDRRVSDALTFLDIGHLADRPPFRLSGGEKRKVAIASVLSMNPDVILLDEPFLGLDPRGQSWLMRTLCDLQCAGKTTILATQTLETVPSIAARALVLAEDHRLALDGPVQDVLRDREALLAANLIEAPGEKLAVS